MVSRYAVILVTLTFSSACATTNRGRTLSLMGGVGLAGAAAGYTLSPPSERPEMHAAFFGALSAALAGLVGLFLFDEQKRSDELERQAGVMRKELDSLREEGSSKEPQLLYETTAPFGKDIPDEYHSLVRPGRWSVYRLNQWVSQGEGTMIHQDRMIRLVPPQLSPNSQTSVSDGVNPTGEFPGNLQSVPVGQGTEPQQIKEKVE